MESHAAFVGMRVVWMKIILMVIGLERFALKGVVLKESVEMLPTVEKIVMEIVILVVAISVRGLDWVPIFCLGLSAVSPFF